MKQRPSMFGRALGELSMKTNRRTVLAMAGLAVLPAFMHEVQAKGKAHHNNGKKLLGDKVKSSGNHVIDKKGPHTVSLDVQDGKIAGMHVKHEKKGELPVKKYKTKKQMAQAGNGIVRVGYMQVQDQYLGTTYIGYAYYDEYGDEVIYWFPYDMILDGDTGAVEYVAAY
jgi:hypothetical protein